MDTFGKQRANIYLLVALRVWLKLRIGLIEMKLCMYCNKEISKKSIRCKSCSNRLRKGKFHSSKPKKDQTENRRKGCRKYYYKHRQQLLEQKQQYYLANKEKIRAYGKEQYKKNYIKKGYKKGDDSFEPAMDYRNLHKWARRNLPKTDICNECKLPKKLEVANISGEYKREINDWIWICHSCHRKLHNSGKHIKPKRFKFNKDSLKWEEVNKMEDKKIPIFIESDMGHDTIEVSPKEVQKAVEGQLKDGKWVTLEHEDNETEILTEEDIPEEEELDEEDKELMKSADWKNTLTGGKTAIPPKPTVTLKKPTVEREEWKSKFSDVTSAVSTHKAKGG